MAKDGLFRYMNDGIGESDTFLPIHLLTLILILLFRKSWFYQDKIMEYLYFINYIEKIVTRLAECWGIAVLEMGARNRDIHTMTPQAEGKQACSDIEQRSTSHFPLKPDQQSS